MYRGMKAIRVDEMTQGQRTDGDQGVTGSRRVESCRNQEINGQKCQKCWKTRKNCYGNKADQED